MPIQTMSYSAVKMVNHIEEILTADRFSNQNESWPKKINNVAVRH